MELVEVVALKNFTGAGVGSCTQKARYFMPKDRADFLVDNGLVQLVQKKEEPKPKTKKKSSSK